MPQKRHILIQIAATNWSLMWELHGFILMGDSAVEADFEGRDEK